MTELKCERNGCKKKFLQEENNSESCHYHPGKPIFHDLKKGWTCCKKIVYDWDEFEKLPTCSVGEHCNKKEELLGQDAYFKSNTVNNAKEGIDKYEEKPVMNINDYNKKKEEEEKLNIQKEENKEKKVFLNKNGNKRCINFGCNKEFTNENEECNYHASNPVFHDVRKYWSCCKKEAWDFDQFLKLPTCLKGKHNPKLI